MRFDYYNRQTVFLTGASGILGSRVLIEILTSTACHVICLMRDKDGEEACRRLVSALRVYDPNFEWKDFSQRVQVVLGDVSHEGFGLAPEEYERIVHSISTIIHAAASVNFTGFYSNLARINIEGTEQVARLSLDSDAGMIHISTYSIIGDAIFRPDFVFSEDDCDVGQDFGGFSYGRTKLEAEMALRAMPNLRWIILRPGDIYGDSSTGAYPLNTAGRPAFFYDIFKTAVETGICPFRDDMFDITPVDLLAKVIVFLTLQQSYWGQTFHLMNPRPRRFFEVMNQLIEHGYRLRTLPFDEYVELFRKGLGFKDGKRYSSQFTAMTSLFAKHFFKKAHAHFGTAGAEALYQSAGIHFPEIDSRLLDRYFQYCQEIAYFVPPSQQSLASIEGQTQHKPVING